MLREALTLSEWELDGLAGYKDITLPALSTRQKEVLGFAFKYVGYPYVWGGEYPTKDSPYGYQAHGGFDCSGFVWCVLKMHFGYPIGQRARRRRHGRSAKPRISRGNLKPGDIIFWGPNGPKSTAGVDLPRRHLHGARLVHPLDRARATASRSPRSTIGPTGSTYFAWGRRVLTKAQLVVE